ncbi:tRNA (N(6)-L-threonylcarbamoyladenosine(37)-C(2))-methylthiotransferase MtaB [Candidatus Margulisiibacteriota bacterium]
MPTFATYTLGCKVNQSETSQIENFLQKQGYYLVDQSQAPDFTIINTCSVTHVADRKSRQMIRRAKNNNPQTKVIITGCFTVKNKGILSSFNIDHVINNDKKLDFLLWQSVFPKQNKAKQLPQVKIRRMLKIQDGCSTHCAYCIVPYLRQNKTSLPFPEIQKIAKEWVAQGTREIVLTGVNLGNYRWQKYSLLEVIKELSPIEDLYRIRISSLELPDLDPELVTELNNNPKLCKHLHLPLQSGSDPILKKMNRPYSTAEFLEKALQLKETIPDIALTTDVIVGFPGETEADFQNTLKTIKKAGFSRLHVFKYSLRPGTPAAGFKDQIPAKITDQRSKQLLSLSKKLEKEFANKYLNAPLMVLFEEENPKFSQGLTSNYLRVFSKKHDLLGQLVSMIPSKLDQKDHLVAK